MPAVIECLDFSFFHGKKQILERIKFSLEQGQWLSILGPNGSGKSTLLKNMMRLADGRAGGLIMAGALPLPSYSQKDLARLFAYMPQAGGRLPPFTVREFAYLSRYPCGPQTAGTAGASNKQVTWALALTGMERFADSRLEQLSGGERQRAYLAAALAQGARTLLLDEPAAFLDPKHASDMNNLLKSLHEKEGYTIIIVTHDLSQAINADGKALVLAAGKQVYFGDSQELAGGNILERAFDYKFTYIRHPESGRQLVLV